VAGTPAAPFLAEGSDKLFQGARSTVTAAVKSLDFVRAQKRALFSVREWIKSGQGVLFLPYQADQIAALKAIISIWMRLAVLVHPGILGRRRLARGQKTDRPRSTYALI
jgi:hypothetical protein